jgi:hypothetical protein
MNCDIQVTGLDAHGVTLVSPADPAFDDLARPLLGRIADLALRLKPYLVIVSNETSVPVVAFTVAWKVSGPSGPRLVAHSQFKCPEAVCGDGSLARDDDQPILPGARRIVGNGCAVGPQEEFYDHWIENFIQRRDQELTGATAVEVSLDAAIFADGVLVGVDESKLGDHFAEYVRAKQEVYRGIVDRLANSPASEDFFAPVRAMLHDPRRPPDFRNPFALYPNQAAAEALGHQRRGLRAIFKAGLRAEPFVVRRRQT